MPQGSLLEQKNKGRTKVKIAVFFVLAVHGIGLLALLMQGCKKEGTSANTAEATNTNLVAPAFDPTNAVVPDTTTVTTITPSNPTPTDVTAPPAPPTEYTIMSGDSYSKLATRFHVTVSSLMAANPGVEPTKLRPGQKIKVPPPAPVVATATPTPTPTNGDTLYSVKSGDTLSKIASEHHTTVKAIRSANSLKTDSIRVGQKLTIPKNDVVATNGTAPKS